MVIDYIGQCRSDNELIERKKIYQQQQQQKVNITNIRIRRQTDRQIDTNTEKE